MTTLLTRLKRRSIHSPPASHAPPATPVRHSMPGAWSELSPLERKIHPDLNSLIIEDSTPILDIGPVAHHDTASGFVPLLPSTRKPSTSLRIQQEEDSSDNVDHDKAQAIRQLFQDVGQHTPPSHIPFTVDASSPNTSGETFGRTAKLTSVHGRETSYAVSDPRFITPVTPDSSSSPVGDDGTRAHSSNHSFESRSNSSHKLESITPSPHTFGIPTPPSSGFTFSPRRHRVHADSETAPPLPPLDHPAFQSSSVSSNVVNSRAMRIFTMPGVPREKDDQQSKQPRHASSLPSMSLPSTKSPHHSRESARPQPRFKTPEIFPSTLPLQSTPRRGFRHSRTKSKDSVSSSRRASAEFSAAQAALIDHTGTAESWEAQVSREMVRMSIGEKQRSGIQNNAAVAKSGQARGNNVWAASIESFSLGSPFLLQYIPNPSDSAPDDNTTGSNLVSAGNKGESNPPRDDGLSPFSDLVAGPAMDPEKSKSPERIRTPSPPPPQINTIPHPVPGGPSSSNLMPPSLSFTAPTPEASPITPVSRTGHQQAATEPSQSVLNPAMAPIVRSASSGHKGKRKADEADEGGNTTPPKDQPRATFAVEPRPHRASGNSASSRATNSGSSRAPSSYHRKRARLSTTPEMRPGSRTSVDAPNQNAATTGSWSSKASSSRNTPQPPPATSQHPHRAPSRRSLSQASGHGSIPMSALISPHAPSIQGSSIFHMRDPRKPPPIQTTPWSLSLPFSGRGSWLERGGSPLHAWLFFVGFLIFPIWWAAAFVGIPRTRRFGGNEVEKGVVLDDPQVEADANSWRKRCRVMAVVSLFTYLPFIILVAIFVR